MLFFSGTSGTSRISWSSWIACKYNLICSWICLLGLNYPLNILNCSFRGYLGRMDPLDLLVSQAAMGQRYKNVFFFLLSSFTHRKEYIHSFATVFWCWKVAHFGTLHVCTKICDFFLLSPLLKIGGKSGWG